MPVSSRRPVHTCTQCMQTPAPVGTLLRPNNTTHPVGTEATRLLQACRPSLTLCVAWGEEAPLGASHGVEQGVSPAGPGQFPGPHPASPLPTGLEGEVHPRELHQGPGGEAGGDGEDWAPPGMKLWICARHPEDRGMKRADLGEAAGPPPVLRRGRGQRWPRPPAGTFQLESAGPGALRLLFWPRQEREEKHPKCGRSCRPCPVFPQSQQVSAPQCPHSGGFGLGTGSSVTLASSELQFCLPSASL